MGTFFNKSNVYVKRKQFKPKKRPEQCPEHLFYLRMQQLRKMNQPYKYSHK